jgi:hypothetical protein
MKREAKKNGTSRKRKAKQQPKKDGFWREKTIEELAAEQGVTLPQRWEDLYGAGEHLWKSDEEFEEFLEFIQQQRTAGK